MIGPGSSTEAAEALAATALFSSLSAVDLARLVPELEERRYPSGEAIFRRGDPPDGLYVIRRGTARVSSSDSGAESGALAMLGPAEYFGEMALLSDEPRSATVIAVTELEVWRLSAERFRALLEQHPNLPLQVAASLSRRLAATDLELARTRHDLRDLVHETLAGLASDERGLLTRAAPLEFARVDVLEDALEQTGLGSRLADLARRTGLLRDGGNGVYRFVDEALRAVLVGELTAELGEAGYRAWLGRLASAAARREDTSTAIALWQSEAAWGQVAECLRAQGLRLLGSDPAALERSLRALPDERLLADRTLVGMLAEACRRRGDLPAAIELYERALSWARQKGVGRAIEYQQALAGLYVEAGRPAEALGSLRVGMSTAGAVQATVGAADGGAAIGVLPRAADDRERVRRGALALAGARGLAEASLAMRRLRLPRARPLVGLLLAGVLLAGWLAPPVAGLGQAGQRALVLLLGSLALSMLGLMPEYAAALIMMGLWVVGGIVPTSVAVSGFASPTWFLLLATMAVGTALARSGLMYRAALELLERLPARYPVLAGTLAALGVLISPGMPNVSGRVSLAGPIAQDVADALRYPDRSGGSAGLAFATFLGFGQMSALFLTASPSALILYGLMPAEVQAQISFVSWFLVALPVHLVVLVGMLGFILWRYRPEADRLSERTLQVQRAVLGRVGRQEWVALAVLATLLLGFGSQSIHRIEPAWLGLFAVALLVVAGLLDADALRRGVNWPFLLYLGVTLSLNGVFSTLRIDRWLGEVLWPIVQALAAAPGLFVLGLALLALSLALVFRMGVTVLILALALFPIADQLHASPWIIALTLLVAANQFLYPQQSVVYLTLYYASEERAFSHSQARPVALVYAGLVFLGLAISVPIWRLLGLLG